MTLRTTVRIFGLAATACVVAAVLVWTKHADGQSTNRAALTTLWSVDFRKITRISIARGDQRAIAEKRNGTWVVASAVRAPESWDDATLLLSRPSVQLVVESPGDANSFGFHPPQMEVQVTTSDGQDLQVLVGDKLPDGSGHYVTQALGLPVYAIDYLWVTALDGLLSRALALTVSAPHQ